VLSKIRKQMGIISVNRANMLMFVVEMECVFCEVRTDLLNNNNNNNINFSKRLKCRRVAHALRFKETFQSRYSSCIKVHNLERPVGGWLGTECSSKVTADAELEDGNENFTSTNFTQSEEFLLVL
jgi:hypothetical protein